MKTPVCELLGIEFPLLAFSHCRDVVAAVTKAGAFGVLGAMRYDADELEVALRWIDEQVGGKPYGVDVIVPRRYEGKGEELDPEALAERISDAHWQFLERLLAEHDLEGVWNREVAIGSSRASGLFSDANVDALLDVAFSHPIRLIANALGPAPERLIEKAKQHGVPCAGLVGAPEHAVRQVQAGVAAGLERGEPAALLVGRDGCAGHDDRAGDGQRDAGECDTSHVMLLLLRLAKLAASEPGLMRP